MRVGWGLRDCGEEGEGRTRALGRCANFVDGEMELSAGHFIWGLRG